MFFGIQEKRVALGRFTSEKCAACKNGTEYAFIKKTKYFVAFFINLIPLKTSYESVCKECDAVEAVAGAAGKVIAKKEFASENAKRNLIDAGKIAAVVIVIAAAVLLPLLLIKVPVSNPQTLKSLVDEDGAYNILDEEGTILGTVGIVDGEKSLLFYDHIRVLVGEDGADGSFLLHEHYSETADDDASDVELERIADDPGVLQDRYLTDVRTYYYDVAADSLGYARGVVDLTSIEYTDDRVVYNYIYYLDNGELEYYAEVLYLTDDKRIRVTFLPSVPDNTLNRIMTIEVSHMDNDRTSAHEIYQFDSATIALAQTSGLSMDSTADEFLGFISQNALTPIQSMIFDYFEDTKVMTQTQITQPDATGAMQTLTQNYIVTEKDGYYIMAPID